MGSVRLSAEDWTRVINALRSTPDTYDLADAIDYELRASRLREAARAVVDQDRSTDEGDDAFERALHRLWVEVHRD